MNTDKKITYIESPDAAEFPDAEVDKLVGVLLAQYAGGTRQKVTSLLTVDPDEHRWVTGNMCQIRDQGQIIIAKDGEDTVGMIGVNELHRTPDGRRIFEIRRNTVLDSSKGQGIGRALRERMIARLSTVDPDALLISRIHHDNTVNQALAESTEFTRITDAKLEELGFEKKWIESAKRQGYEIYLRDLRQNKVKDSAALSEE